MPRDDGSISFYFFDIDDNSLFLETPIFLRNAKTGETKQISTTELASVRGDLGRVEPWVDWETYEDTYSHFRDIPADQKKPGQKEYFVEDIETAIEEPPETWQAPAWPLLVYACEQQRPLAFVTARGHSRETIKAGLQTLVDHGKLAQMPNLLEIYAVSNPEMSEELLASQTPEERARVEALPDRTSALKRIAIRNIVDKAVEKYGIEPEHRFGMSDDDPENVDLIIKAMADCKNKYLDKRFFVINTHHGEHVKLEVFPIYYPVTRRAAKDEVVG